TKTLMGFVSSFISPMPLKFSTSSLFIHTSSPSIGCVYQILIYWLWTFSRDALGMVAGER
ncbi:MAG: hypothetical protein QW351_07635, partial [Candidatus Caldarchaeum sp.]